MTNAAKLIIIIWHADIAQSVERILGKDEVTGSNPVISSIKKLEVPPRYFEFFAFLFRFHLSKRSDMIKILQNL